MRLLPDGLRCALLREAVEKVLVLSGLIGPLFQLENYAVGLQGNQAVELIFCNLDAMGGPLGAEIQQQEIFEACAGTVAPVAVGPHIGAGLHAAR